ncbi:MAG: hypothetical protein NT099_00440 [Candidatus Saganbacteria bacterium]|nr:hypothetical protein [Candidatus Saganbacteria bacterium]
MDNIGALNISGNSKGGEASSMGEVLGRISDLVESRTSNMKNIQTTDIQPNQTATLINQRLGGLGNFADSMA